MANEVQWKFDSESSFTITLNSLANAAGRCSNSVANSNQRPAALITVKLTSGSSAPTAGQVAEVYLLRDTGTEATDDWAGSDASFSPENAYCLGSIVFTATTTKEFIKEFDTYKAGPLGPNFGIAIVNNSGSALHSSGNAAYYRYYVPEIQ